MGRRKHVRFEPDLGAVVILHLKNKKDVAGLLVSESKGGCSCCVVGEIDLIKGDRCQLDLPHNVTNVAEVVWIKSLGEDVNLYGMKYVV